jgi:hypothetical protein
MYEDDAEKFNQGIMDVEINNLIKDYEDYIDRLRHTLPWAEASMPIFGGGTALHSNWKSSPFKQKRITNVQDFPMLPNWKSIELGAEFDVPSQGIPRENPCFAEIEDEALMVDYMTGIPSVEGADPLAQIWFQNHLVDQDKPSNLGTKASSRGMLSVPAFGSKVWVFFLGGDLQRPVYFGQSVESASVLPAGR